MYVRKGVPDHAVKAYRGTRGVAPVILNLGARWKWVFSIAPLPLYPREKIRPVPIEEEAGWSPAPVWSVWRTEKSLIHAGIRTPDRPERSLVAIPTTL